MERKSASEVRRDFSDSINKVAFGKNRLILHRRGKNIAALIPIDDLELLEAIEDRIDLEDAKRARKEKGSVSLAEAKKLLAIDED
jgi:antitoxin Phd